MKIQPNSKLRGQVPAPIDLQAAVRYEIYGSRFTPYISWVWLQKIAGNHYARKAQKKHARYKLQYETYLKLKK